MKRDPMAARGTVFFLAVILWIFCGLPAVADANLPLDPSLWPLKSEGESAPADCAFFDSEFVDRKEPDREDGLMKSGGELFPDRPFRLTGTHLPIKFTGAEPMSRSLFFNDPVLRKGQDAHSEIDINLYDLTISWNAGSEKMGSCRLEWGPELSLKIIDSEVSARDEAFLVRENDTVTLPFPTAGAWARLSPADWVNLTGRFGYMEYNRNSLLNGDLQIVVNPAANLGLFLGYRHLSFDMDATGDFIDATLEGFYGGALIRY